jgi:hypothetical protein
LSTAGSGLAAFAVGCWPANATDAAATNSVAMVPVRMYIVCSFEMFCSRSHSANPRHTADHHGKLEYAQTTVQSCSQSHILKTTPAAAAKGDHRFAATDRSAASTTYHEGTKIHEDHEE